MNFLKSRKINFKRGADEAEPRIHGCCSTFVCENIVCHTYIYIDAKDERVQQYTNKTEVPRCVHTNVLVEPYLLR